MFDHNKYGLTKLAYDATPASLGMKIKEVAYRGEFLEI